MKKIIIAICNSFSKQLKENWVDYILTIIIGLVLVCLFRQQDQNKAKKDFFKYSYNSQTKSINIETQPNFRILSIQWFVPGLYATSTGSLSNGEIRFDDIINMIKENGNLGPFFYQGSRVDIDGYIKCVLINEFSAGLHSASSGYPVFVKNQYFYKDNVDKPITSLGIIFINQSSFKDPWVFYHEVSTIESWNYYFANGITEWKKVRANNKFDPDKEYLDSEGNCRTQFIFSPIIHIDLDKKLIP